ncbi:MAG: T9SS type A sorting domain-containing protein [Calditrichia bacterium]
MYKKLLLLSVCLLLLAGTGAEAAYNLTLNLSDVTPLANGYHYEGWAIINGMPVSTGKFNVDAGGNLVDLNGNVIPNNMFTVVDDLSMATAIVLTIEPDGDPDPGPADTHFLAGDLSGTAAMLTAGHPAALGDDFTGAMGNYILATPTNGPNTDENSGIWFLDLSTTVQLSFNDLPALANGYHYEGWAIVDGMPISTGKFNVDLNGDLVDLNGIMIPNGEFKVNRNINSATAIVLTIEPPNDTDPAPAHTHFLAGDVSGSMASLSVGHGAALGDDFTGAMGNYILATPTNGPNTDENSGIWFLDLTSGSPMQGLNLPVLPDGWAFEGWTVINGMPVTSGKFLKADSQDWADPYSSNLPGPPFPGEDFLLNAPAGLTFPTDIAGGTAVISIEPMPDDDPAPFALKPLVGDIPANAVDHFTYSMNNNAGVFPTGSATLIFNGPAVGLHLPVLPNGWAYEGWAVINGMPVTSGKFLRADSQDWADPYSSTLPGPPFPGEDFLVNAPAGLTFPTDLAGGAAVISIEPMPDDDPAPFAFKPLVGMIPPTAGDHITYMMGNNAGAFPSGMASVTVVDNTAPTCELTNVIPGPPLSIEITGHDPESGLMTINVVKAKNANVSIPSFTTGTTSPVVITATKIDQNKRASVALEFIDMAGNSLVCDPVYSTLSALVPERHQLHQNYPNPFNPSTTFNFDVAPEGDGLTPVSLVVYDVTGRQVKVLLDEPMQPGQYSVQWDGTNSGNKTVAGGVYLVRYRAGSFTTVKRILLLK